MLLFTESTSFSQVSFKSLKNNSFLCEEHRFSLCLKCFFQNACQAVSPNLSYAITFSSVIPSVAICLAHFVFKYVAETATSSINWMLLKVKTCLLLYIIQWDVSIVLLECRREIQKPLPFPWTVEWGASSLLRTRTMATALSHQYSYCNG